MENNFGSVHGLYLGASGTMVVKVCLRPLT